MPSPERCSLRLELKPSTGVALEGLRSLTAADETALAHLMYHAYLGTVDYEGETEAGALSEVRRTFAGNYGQMIWSASRVLEREGLLASAALVTRSDSGPFLAFSMTHPRFKRRGFARACVQSAANQLWLEGARDLRLVVTLANTEALRLYLSLGFKAQDEASFRARMTPERWQFLNPARP